MSEQITGRMSGFITYDGGVTTLCVCLSANNLNPILCKSSDHFDQEAAAGIRQGDHVTLVGRWDVGHFRFDTIRKIE
jgi:hypothetical protein